MKNVFKVAQVVRPPACLSRSWERDSPATLNKVVQVNADCRTMDGLRHAWGLATGTDTPIVQEPAGDMVVPKVSHFS